MLLEWCTMKIKLAAVPLFGMSDIKDFMHDAGLLSSRSQPAWLFAFKIASGVSFVLSTRPDRGYSR